jgi:hypothetical protein
MEALIAQIIQWITQLNASVGNVANLVTVIAAGISLLTYLKVKSEARKLRQNIKKLPPPDDLQDTIKRCQKINSAYPVALGFSLSPTVGSIKKPIQEYLRIQGWKMPVEEINMNGINGESDILEFYNQTRNIKLELESKGYTEVHLFFSGPVQAATIVGCLFSNWMPVKLYHKQQGSGYVYWMPLIK